MSSWKGWKILCQGTVGCIGAQLAGDGAAQGLDPWPLPNWCCKAVPRELLGSALGFCSWWQKIPVGEPEGDLTGMATRPVSGEESQG